MAEPFRVGFLLFPNLTQLDLTGPWEVLSGLPETETRLVWKTAGPVTAGKGMTIMADTGFADCPQLDLICVPGGYGVGPLMADDEVLDFLRRQAEGARYVTSVCTGSLVLGAAGLLKGRRATSHWSARELLARFGAIPTAERVVIDGNVITGGGVTAGIDFALRIAAELHGDAVAQATQLQIEYDPAPPFDAGSPASAPSEILERARTAGAPRLAERRAQVEQAAVRLGD
ncbi:DJ-1/PfpI family protein [Enterovirga rhinocerotis]|uniref:Cyclohexyl-isocyanide hydratase n=1 Tax=Enterovirga rhinocerotis TaxID=1339210 RepID=A0A4V3DZ31_9HYPH|nr:DJ-1/PfpI family protein [Enterovirga rhinocerotis]TDR94969.1 cyclohexyl-isocyanide hydratase [Enterovirga rhinocerotis]